MWVTISIRLLEPIQGINVIILELVAQLIIHKRRKKKRKEYIYIYINIESDLHPKHELSVVGIELQNVNPSWWLINLSKSRMIFTMINTRLKYTTIIKAKQLNTKWYTFSKTASSGKTIWSYDILCQEKF